MLLVLLASMFPDHVLEQMFAVPLEVMILVVAVIDLLEAVHIHLAYEGDGLLRVELVVVGAQVAILELVAVQVDQLAIV